MNVVAEIVDWSKHQHQPVQQNVPTIERLAGMFLVTFSNPDTRRSYAADLQFWFEFCAEIDLDPMKARRSHFSLFMLGRGLLAYNALRIGEVIRADVTDMAQERHNHTLDIMGKGTKPAVVVLNGPTKWALDQALDGRTKGPLILSGIGGRLTRESAGRTCRRIAKHAGITGKNITPHSFRHSAITAAHDDGADPRAVQEFARHVKYQTTIRYDHKRSTLDEHLSYRLAGYVSSRSV